MTELLVDDRERHVIPFLLATADKNHIVVKVQRLTVGDYAVVSSGKVLVVIERKTWVDLAQSFRDGRKENVNKLINARAETGCKLVYLIEGDAYPMGNKLYSMIPAKNLRAHLDHLMIRDNVNIIYSRDAEYTAARLIELLLAVVTLGSRVGGSGVSGKLVDQETGQETSQVAVLTKKQVSTVNIDTAILRCVPSVGPILADVFAAAGVSLVSLVQSKHTIDDLAAFKYPSGASVGLIRAEKILRYVGLIKLKSKLAKKIQVRILSAVPLVSRAAAVYILQDRTLFELMGKTVEEVAEVKKSKKETKVGLKAAQGIVKYLSSGAAVVSAEYEFIEPVPDVEPVPDKVSEVDPSDYLTE